MPEGLTVQIRRLTVEDDRTQFSSGDIELDRFFQRFAGQIDILPCLKEGDSYCSQPDS